MKSAIETMKQEMLKIHSAMAECIEPSGYIRSDSRYKYQMLVSKLREFKESVEWLESQIYSLTK